VRTILRLLEEKGHLRHEEENMRYVYVPTVSPEKASKSALKQVLRVFFNDSAEQSVAAILDLNRSKLSDSELDRLSRLIEQARKDGR
jgi:predicted transcriptional regulator